MRQDDADPLRGFLALNALLREELRDVRRLVDARTNETKYNPNWRWQPRAPVGTREGGRWIDSGKDGGPKNGGNRNRQQGHNRPPIDTLQQIFRVPPDAPASAILIPLDDFLGLSAPGAGANEAATRNLADSLIAEIQSIDPQYRPPALAEPGGFPRTIEGRNNHINTLRADRAAALYRIRGQIEPLQTETLRFMQREVDAAYARGRVLLKAERLDPRLSNNEALGNYIDGQVRAAAVVLKTRDRSHAGPADRHPTSGVRFFWHRQDISHTRRARWSICVRRHDYTENARPRPNTRILLG